MGTLKNTVKLAIGTVAEQLFPRLASEIRLGKHTGRNIKLKQWIIFAQTERAYRYGDIRATEHALKSFWRADVSNTFYDNSAEQFSKWFLGPHREILDKLVELSGQRSLRQFVEIGCGDGRVLAHCADRMPSIPAFVGIDINASIIKRDKIDYSDRQQLQFVAADAKEWLAMHTTPGTVVFTFGGVMEYFSAEALSDIFNLLAAHVGCAVALVEPVDPMHNLDTDPGSHLFGLEHSFSHNHAALLRAAGFSIRFQKEISLSGIRWMMLLADRQNEIAGEQH